MIKRVIVRYTVKPDRVADNERLVREVYEELHRVEPAGIRYATFLLDDGVTFVHIASVETDDGHNPLEGLAGFQEFQRDLSARVSEGPIASELGEVGSYRLLDAG
jgi:hypothetical protein